MRGRRAAAGALVVGVLAAGAAVLAPRTSGFSATRFEVVAGAAWLPSYRIGQVALVDGTTSDTVARVDVVDRESALDVVQTGSSAVVVRRETGAVTRVDGGTLDTVAATPFGKAEDLQAFAGPTSLFVYDRRRGALAVLDSDTLQLRRRVALAPARTPRSVTVDGEGRLWVVSGDTGALRRYDAAGTVLTGGRLADPARADLVLVRGRPVVVDAAGDASVREVDPQTGALRPAACLPGGRDGVRSAGSRVRDLVYLADSGQGALLVSDLRTGRCGVRVEVAPPGSALGTPVEIGDVVLVADWTHSRVVLVDTRTWTVRRLEVPVPRGAAFDLLEGTGFAYYNDPRSEHAGVITLTGAVLPSRKYDPDDLTATGRRRARVLPSASPSVTPSVTVTATPSREPDRRTRQRRSSPPPPEQGQTPTATPTPSAVPTPTDSPTRPPAVLQIAVDPPASPQVDKPFRFQARLQGQGRIAGVDWTFGDGGVAEGVDVTHAYAKASRYTVTATAVLADGSTLSRTATIEVQGEPVVQIAGLGPGETDEDTPTRFSAVYVNGTPTTYQWTVRAPDGRILTTSVLPEPTFTFADPTPDAGAPYVVVLRIDDDERSVPVVVGPARPTRATVTCTPSRPVVASSVTCSATASGYVSQWHWTVTNSQTGTVTRTTTVPRLALAPLGENVTRVQVVAANRAGSSAPAATELTPEYTALGPLSCTPSPILTDTTVTCTVTAYGWSSGYDNPRWSLTAEGGATLSGSLSSTCDGQCRLRWTTRFTRAGDYAVSVSYTGPGGHRVTNGGVVSVTVATRTLTVVAPAGVDLSTDDHSCGAGRTCRWTYDRGTQVAVRADPQEGYNVYGWQPDCGVDRQPGICAVVLDDDTTVRPLVGRSVTLRLVVDPGTYCRTGEDPATDGCKAWDAPFVVTMSNGQGALSDCTLDVGAPGYRCAISGEGPVTFSLTTDHQPGVTWTGCDSHTTRRCTVRVSDTDPNVEATFR
ncbi:MAG: PKD domain-containing protein [Kineosporiaceae bacterium]